MRLFLLLMASEFFLVGGQSQDDIYDDDSRDEDDNEEPGCIDKDSLIENALESPESVVCIAAKGFADEQSLNIDGSFPMLERIEAESFLNAKGSVAFRNCAVLASIETRAFKGFKGTLKFGNCLQKLSTLGEAAFNGAGRLQISDGFNALTTIPSEAFFNATGKITQTDGSGALVSIGESAFAEFAGDIVLAGEYRSLASIGGKAFSLVKGSLTLSGTFSSLTSIGGKAFAEASGKVELFSGGAPGGQEVLDIGTAAFQGIVGEQTSVQLPMNQNYAPNPFGGMCGSSPLKSGSWFFGPSKRHDGYCKVQCNRESNRENLNIQYFGVVVSNILMEKNKKEKKSLKKDNIKKHWSSLT